ncbi:helix-turn-helix domain-containing protein [Luteolibacter pohnpeiensis]|uniref:Helix-turn-helix domain-containing protein n=1 Tax=Luteolibacter pohnpeiensis TaxID=454153 RepID=A0A934SA18_9BACT|nr:helix-turn-helix domain-containing protein [Luteolibacter pohnpeiensis]MBK1882099.1 helix-turn-helix domain-containing protein [Luteolibacter pohnpeiensis]
MTEASEFTRRIYERLKSSERFLRYQDAFRASTGLPLRLVPADVDSWCLDDNIENRSSFCERINLCNDACKACREVNRKLMIEAEVNGPSTCRCFSGMSATAVAVKLGAETVGFLKTGQIFQQTPTEEMFEQTIGAIGRKSLTESEIEALKNSYFQTKALDPRRYAGMIELIVIFADQLSKDADEAALAEDSKAPEVVKKALKYIHSHLDQRLTLNDVAPVAGASGSHFCRIFKEATGLTFTDYVNHSRIQWAQRELLAPRARVSEIAFLVGYQSLSQFNRSFARITGLSPSEFRRQRSVAA